MFLGARRQISWSRALLSAELIEKMECLKHWLTNKALDNITIEVAEEALDTATTEGGDEQNGVVN